MADVLDVPAHGAQCIATFGTSPDGDESVWADVDAFRWPVHGIASSLDQRWSVVGVRGMGHTGSEFCNWVDDGVVTTATMEDG